MSKPKLTKAQKNALAGLFEAIDHIQLPFLLSQKQAEVYNALVFAEVRLKVALEWD